MKKRLLLSSIMMIVLCVSLISGATFALFTSESKTNIAITSGKVELVANVEDVETWSLEDDYTSAGRTDYTFTQGGTVVIEEGKVSLNKVIPGDKVKFTIAGTNKSNVKTLYRVVIKAEEACKLLEGLEISINGVAYTSLYSYTTAWVELGAQQPMEDVEVSILLPAQAGDEYQDLVANLLVSVEAVQGNAEVEDESEVVSFEIVGNEVELRAAFANSSRAITNTSKYIVLSEDVQLDADDTIMVAKGTSYHLDLNGHTIEGTSNLTGANRNMIDVRGELKVSNGALTFVHEGDNMGWNNSTNIFNVTDGGVLVLEEVQAENLGGSDMAFVAHLNNWGEVTLEVNNSQLTSTYCAVRVFNSGYDMNNVTITNSTLAGSNMAFWVHNYTMEDFGNDATKVEAAKARLNFNFLVENPVSGVNPDDASNLNAKANNTMVGKIRFGFTNGEVYYNTAESVLANSNTSLDSAIAAGADTIYLGSGNYIIPDSAQGKTLTIKGNGNTVVATQDDGSYEGCDYSLDGATVTFEGVVINTDSTTYTGYARLNATYNNCTINGTYTLYGDSEFNNCTFNVSGDVYNIWTWGAPNATFNNCTFNSDGKALLLYGTENTKLTLNNCTFNDNGGLDDLKAAVEIGNDYNKSYTLIVNNTVVNGYEINDKGINTGTTLWANKNSMSQDKLNVVVDGVDVY